MFFEEPDMSSRTNPLALLALFLLLPWATPTVVAQELPLQPLQVVLDSARTALGMPGASAAVVFPDGNLWEGASGVASPGIPASPATAFELGSITKTYTAAVVLQLNGEGRIRVEDPVASWFPGLPGVDGITVGQLLNHTHGLHDPLQEPDFVPAVLQEPTKVWTLGDVLVRMGAPHFEPGAGWRYSNTGFHLLGAIVEAVTDSIFTEVLEARLFKSLGLEGSWYGMEDPPGAPLAAAYIDPSGSGTAQPVSLLMPWTAFRSSAGPAGAVVSTAGDAARFIHGLSTGSVLPEAAWRQMTTWVDRPDGNRYGLGLLQIEEEGVVLLGHKGNSAGYSASAFHDPSSGLTAVVLTNGHSLDVTPMVTALLRAGAALGRTGM
jgi:D-alanyl-D-alanine carboxypeptidase